MLDNQTDAPLEAPLPVKPLEKRLEQALDDDGGVRGTASPAPAAASGWPLAA